MSKRIINGIFSAEDVASKLDKPQRTQTGWLACCPAHQDKTPSLSIDDGANEKILVKCFAGCTQQEVVAALRVVGAWPEYEQEIAPRSNQKLNVVETYNYIDQHSELVFQVLRLDPKDFRQRTPKPDGGWAWSLKSLEKLVPYKLPTIIETTTGICLCEGEKDADNLESLGFVTTTFAGGAGAWREEYAQWFKDRRVYIIQDNDKAGEEGSIKRAKQLSAVATQVKIIKLPNNGAVTKDVTDWIVNGGTKKEFIELCKLAPEYGVVDIVPDPSFGQPDQEMVNLSTGFIEWQHQTDKGKPLTTLETTEQLLQAYGIHVRYNVTKKELEVTIPGRTWLVDNAENCALAEIISLATRHGLADGKIKQYLVAIADKYAYNPFLNWITSVEWDGESRIAKLYESLDCQNEDQELAAILLKRWCIGVIESNCNPTGISNSSVLVLQGEQYSGKTTWFWQLVNKNRSWGREACILNPAMPDSVYQAVSYAIVELGELDATFRRADIAALKGFITKDFDRLRRPYAAADSQFPRRTVFFATVNPEEFLHDETGNRRFWTLKCGSGMNPNHHINMQQLWAECKVLWDKGERHTLTRDEVKLLEQSNSKHEAASVVDEMIEKYFHHDAKKILWEWKTATDVLIDIGYKNPNVKDRTACAASIRKRYPETMFKGQTRYYHVPPVKMQNYAI